jgi:hypothetical protein
MDQVDLSDFHQKLLNYIKYVGLNTIIPTQKAWQGVHNNLVPVNIIEQ